MDSDITDESADDGEKQESAKVVDDVDLFLTTEAKQKDGPQAKESHLEDTVATNAEATSRFQWRAGQHISPPRGRSNCRPSPVKAESFGCFRSPLASFLAFVPLKSLKSMVCFQMCMRTLMKMALRPTPGQLYDKARKRPTWHPCTRHMPLRRFQLM
jgi:hypothetical protein